MTGSDATDGATAESTPASASQSEVSSPPISASSTPVPKAAKQAKGKGTYVRPTAEEEKKAAAAARSTTGSVASHKTRFVIDRLHILHDFGIDLMHNCDHWFGFLP